MIAPDLPIPTHDASLFSWRGNHGVAEESDLGARPYAQVWSDSCDVGFYVRSPRTGAVHLFTHKGDIKDVSGELLKSLWTSSFGECITLVND